MAIFLCGLLDLFSALDIQTGTARLTSRLGVAATTATLPLYGFMPGGGRRRPQASGERVGRCPRGRKGGEVRRRRGDAMARVRSEELRELHARPGCAVGGRSRPDGADPANDRVPHGVLGPHLSGAGMTGGRGGFSPTHTIAIVLAEVLNAATWATDRWSSLPPHVMRWQDGWHCRTGWRDCQRTAAIASCPTRMMHSSRIAPRQKRRRRQFVTSCTQLASRRL
jgi:hypothetical protein